MDKFYKVLVRDETTKDGWRQIDKYLTTSFALARARDEEKVFGEGNVRVREEFEIDLCY